MGRIQTRQNPPGCWAVRAVGLLQTRGLEARALPATSCSARAKGRAPTPAPSVLSLLGTAPSAGCTQPFAREGIRGGQKAWLMHQR